MFSNTYTPPPSHTPTGGEDDYSHTDGCDGGTAAVVAAAYNNNIHSRRRSGVLVGAVVSAANYAR